MGHGYKSRSNARLWPYRCSSLSQLVLVHCTDGDRHGVVERKTGQLAIDFDIDFEELILLQ